MTDELNVLPTEEVNVETLPAEACKTNVVKNVALIAGGVTLVGAAVYLTIRLVKKHKAKKAETTETVEESKTE